MMIFWTPHQWGMGLALLRVGRVTLTLLLGTTGLIYEMADWYWWLGKKRAY